MASYSLGHAASDRGTCSFVWIIRYVIAPQAQFQSAGLGTKAPDDVRVESGWLGRYVLFDELVRETPAVDFFKI